MRNVLLPTNFSECSARAFNYAIGIAGRYEAHLYLFHCVDPTPFNLAENPGAAQTACTDIRHELEQLAVDLSCQYGAINIDVQVVAGNLATILPRC